VLGQIIQFVIAAVSMNEVGSASGVMEASQQLSTSLGVAVLGAIFLAVFKSHPATEALWATAWICLVPLAVAFALVFLLPYKPSRNQKTGPRHHRRRCTLRSGTLRVIGPSLRWCVRLMAPCHSAQ
jgi:hypothetical protein